MSYIARQRHQGTVLTRAVNLTSTVTTPARTGGRVLSAQTGTNWAKIFCGNPDTGCDPDRLCHSGICDFARYAADLTTTNFSSQFTDEGS